MECIRTMNSIPNIQRTMSYLWATGAFCSAFSTGVGFSSAFDSDEVSAWKISNFLGKHITCCCTGLILVDLLNWNKFPELVCSDVVWLYSTLSIVNVCRRRQAQQMRRSRYSTAGVVQQMLCSKYSAADAIQGQFYTTAVGETTAANMAQ